MISKTYLHPIRTSDFSDSVSYMMAYWPDLPLSTKIVPIQNWNTPFVAFLNYPSKVLEYSMPHPTVLNMFNLHSTGDKKKEYESSIQN